MVNQVDSTLTVEVTYQGVGWVGFGVSRDGLMPGSEVVIAMPDQAQGASNPGKYNISGRNQGAIVLSGQQTLTDASFEQSGGVTILRFTKALAEDGELEISATGPNTFVYAVGSSNTFGYHLSRGSITLDSLLQCLEVGQAPDPDEDSTPNVSAGDSEPPNKSLWIAHGILMFIAWGILLPIGIGCSMVRRLVPGNGMWFQIHRICNGTAFLLMTAGFGIAVHNVNEAGTEHFSESRHRTIGLIIYVFSFVQVLGGIFRPHLPHAHPPKEVEPDVEADDAKTSPPQAPEAPKKSIQRVAFEVGHRTFGFGLLGLSWYNLYLGIVAIVALYGSYYDKSAAMWGVIGGISGLILVLFVYTKAVPEKKD
jgi:hypothetical protein